MALPNYILYKNQAVTAITTSFVATAFVDAITATPFQSTGLIVSNDQAAAADLIYFSFDGTATHGEVKGGETLTFDRASKSKIWLKGSSAGYSYRLWAW